MKKKALSLALILTLCLSLFSISALAAAPPSGTCGENNNITWILQNDGTLLLSGTGNTPFFGGFYFAEDAPWDIYADQIKYIRVQGNITGINPGAFEACTSAIGITLPASLQFFSEAAWPAGDALQFVITDPNSTNYIAYSGVLYAEHPATDQWEVGEGVSSLVYYPPALKYESTTSYIVRVGTQAIAPYAFGGNKFLKAIVLPDSVKEIGYRAFADCSSLEMIQLSNEITKIPDLAFENCRSLKELTLPSGLKAVEASAFWFCDALDMVVIPASVTTFGTGMTSADGFTVNLSLHKDFYFRGNAPVFDVSGDLSMGWDGDNYACIGTNIYYPSDASGWQDVIKQYKDAWGLKFIPDSLTLPEDKDFTYSLPQTFIYDGSSKTAAVRDVISSSAHNGFFTLAFTDGQNNPVTDLVKPGTYRVLARVSAHGDYSAAEVSLGSVTITEAPGLHGKISISFGDTQSSNGTAYVPGDVVVTVYATPDPGYQLSTLRVVRDNNGQQIPVSGSGNTRTFRMPPADISIQAEFSVR